MAWKDFVPALNDKCLCLTPFCDEVEVSNALALGDTRPHDAPTRHLGDDDDQSLRSY
jgi:hypothetical protein